ncbi:hypothetical protein HUT16_17395 [Kitasatospora sp. NA04385]|uniref:hypothetical protein n=1 Tax=Kitasatospora sp. NA04385 TaxID=2742135 RepID=UPI001590AEEC|nr:hypothetical protein [Kitasatospora sp. NA04385]QKW20608.1 hypothetical protein HUT16_17395 [Kitasatospora sp. NA04385]
MNAGPAPARTLDGTPAFAGRLIVMERLGLDTYDMLDRHPDPGELRTLARLLRGQANRVDDADDQLRRLAASAITRLERTRNGDHMDIRSHGLLRTLATDIETLAARYDLGVEQLGRDLHAYRQAVERSTGTEQHSRTQAAQARSSAAAAPDAALTAAAPGTRTPPGAGAQPAPSRPSR